MKRMIIPIVVATCFGIFVCFFIVWQRHINKENKEIVYYETEAKVEVRLSSDWSSINYDGRVFQDLIDEFNEMNPDMVVINDCRQKEEYLEYLRMDITSGNEPDIFINYAGANMILYIDNGKIACLNKYLQEDEAWYESFDKSVWNSVSYKGNIYGLPMENIYAAMFVNVDVLEEYDLNIPTTYQELENVIEVLKSHGIVPIAFNLMDNELMLYQAIVAKLGGKFYSGNIEVNGTYNDNYVNAAHYLRDLYQAGAFPNNLFSITEQESANLFLEKKAAILIHNSHFVVNIENWDDETVQICFLPDFEGAKASERSAMYGVGKNNLFVSAKSMENKEEYIIRFLKYMTSPGVAEKLKNNLGALSAVNPHENMFRGNIAYVNREFIYNLTEVVDFISTSMDEARWNLLVENMPAFLEGDKEFIDIFQ